MPPGRPVHEFAMPPCAELEPGQGLVVITASAGSLKPMSEILSTLPLGFPAAVVVVQHRGEQSPELLPAILASRASLPVRHARNGDYLKPGTVYVIPPGVHVTVERSLRLVEAPRLEHVRPNANLMLRSAADVFGGRAIAVVLSGMGSDGALGCRAIRQAGGTVIVQDPQSCGFPSMPAATINLGEANDVLPVDRIAPAIAALLAQPERGLNRSARAPMTRVLLADDHRMIRQGLRALLETDEGFDVIAEAEDGRSAVGLAADHQPDVIVMDVAMPDLDGISATRQIVARDSRAKIVALSALSDTGSTTRILDAGASGYLTKNGAFDELAAAIRTVVDGMVYLSPDLKSRFLPGELQRYLARGDR